MYLTTQTIFINLISEPGNRTKLFNCDTCYYYILCHIIYWYED